MFLFSISRSILQTIFVITAVINEIIVYIIVATRNIKSPMMNVTTKNIANIIAATKNGHLKIFCNAIDIIITAIGKAKNISKVFICFLPSSTFSFIIFYAFNCILVTNHIPL